MMETFTWLTVSTTKYGLHHFLNIGKLNMMTEKKIANNSKLNVIQAKNIPDHLFLINWQLPLIQFTSNFLCMFTYCSAHVQEVSDKSKKD